MQKASFLVLLLVPMVFCTDYVNVTAGTNGEAWGHLYVEHPDFPITIETDVKVDGTRSYGDFNASFTDINDYQGGLHFGEDETAFRAGKKFNKINFDL